MRAPHKIQPNLAPFVSRSRCHGEKFMAPYGRVSIVRHERFTVSIALLRCKLLHLMASTARLSTMRATNSVELEGVAPFPQPFNHFSPGSNPLRG